MNRNNIISALVLSAFAVGPAMVLADDSAVTVQEDQNTLTLKNGYITTRILKRSGDIRSFRYKGTEIFTDRSGHAGGYWSHDTTGGSDSYVSPCRLRGLVCIVRLESLTYIWASQTCR
jgi:hypothetical protein